MNNNLDDKPLENLADDPFDSDSDSTGKVLVKNDKNKTLDTIKGKEIMSMDPSILNLNRKLLNDIKNLSINDDIHNNDGQYDPSFDILHIEDPALLDETSINENKTTYNDDIVYLSNIYDIFNKLSNKLDDMMERRFVDKQFINEIYQKAKENDNASVLEQTKRLLSKEDIKNISYSSIQSVLDDFSTIIPEIENNILGIQDGKQRYENILDTLLKEERDSLKVLADIKMSLRNKIRDFMIVYNGVNSNYQISMNPNETSSSSNKSMNTAFKLENVDLFLKLIFEHFVAINKENKKLIKDIDTIKSNNDINTLNKTVENNRKMIKRLQDENISFSDAVNKLNEINIKLKKECVLISSEYKKLTESNREKKRTIEKQKKVIELLQSKLGENLTSPLDEIKLKLNNLKLDIEKEQDPEKKSNLKKNFEDTRRRLEDFEAVINKKNRDEERSK